MARGTPTFSSGTIPSAASGVIDSIIEKIVDRLTNYQSNGEQAWELADEIVSGWSNYEAVYHSVGDRSLGSGSNKGDTDIWLYLHRNSDDILTQVAQDYSPTTGNWGSGAYREQGVSSNGFNDLSDIHETDWWCVVNEYEFSFVIKQGGDWYALHAGQLIRPFGEKINGVARLTSQSGTGSSVTIGLDRDISSNISVGQSVWLMNQTPAATGIQSVGIDIVEVTAVSATDITVDGVTNTYAVGSLVGLDPAPVYHLPGGDSYVRLVQLADGTYNGATSNIAEMKKFTPGDPNDMNPVSADGLYRAFPVYASMRTGSDPEVFRGQFEFMRMFPDGTQAALDIMRIDFDTSNQFILFDDSDVAPVAGATNYFLGLGPGAS